MVRWSPRLGAIGLLTMAMVVSTAAASASGLTPRSNSQTSVGTTSGMPRQSDLPGGLTESEYFALSTEEQLELKLSEEGDPLNSDLPGLIPSESVEFSSATSEFSDAIIALGAEYADVFTSFAVNDGSQSITIAIAAAATEERRGAFKEAVANVLSAYPYAVDFPEKQYTRQAVQAVSDELTREFSIWMPRFGDEAYYSIPDAHGDGVVRVFTSGVPEDEWISFEHRSVPVVVTSVDGDVVKLQSRLSDASPSLQWYQAQ